MAEFAEGVGGATGAGLTGSSTILGGHRPEDHLADLWCADRCRALSRDQRAMLIDAASRSLVEGNHGQ
jgi:hypothetical protein